MNITKWEYCQHRSIPPMHDDDLVIMGNMGWELVAVVAATPGYTLFHYYFKRPRV